MQLDKTKVNSITIVFRSWSCSFPPVEVVDQPTVQNSQTVLVALLNLMQLMKVSNMNSGGETNYALLYLMIVPMPFFCENMELQEQSISLDLHTLPSTFSYTFSISSVYFHGLCAVWILFNFRINSETQKPNKIINEIQQISFKLW